MSRGWRAAANAFIALFLGAHVYALARGVEDFPLSAAVMFAREVTPRTPLYEFRWEVHTADARAPSEAVAPLSLGLQPRHFFLHVYGAEGPEAPYLAARPRTRAEFEQRLSTWFRWFEARYQRQTGRMPTRIDLFLIQRHPRSDRRLIGSYDGAAKRFVAHSGAGA